MSMSPFPAQHRNCVTVRQPGATIIRADIWPPRWVVMSTAPTTLTNDRLVYMLFLATLFHGVLIMGVSFRQELTNFASPPLEVVLVGQGPSTEAPERSRYIAERSQRAE